MARLAIALARLRVAVMLWPGPFFAGAFLAAVFLEVVFLAVSFLTAVRAAFWLDGAISTHPRRFSMATSSITFIPSAVSFKQGI